MKILYICTGNTCRSPVCAYYTKTQKPEIEAESRGLSVYFAQPAAEHMIKIAQNAGMDLRAHRAKQLTEEDIKNADYILTMTGDMKAQLIEMYPDCERKIKTLYEAAGDEQKDVYDPYGGDYDTYSKCYHEMACLIDRFLKHI